MHTYVVLGGIQPEPHHGAVVELHSHRRAGQRRLYAWFALGCRVQQGLGLVVETAALIESDVADGRLRIVYESREKLPAYFIVTLPGPKRAAARAFLKWLKSQI